MKKLVVFAAALALLTGCAADSSSTGGSADSTATQPVQTTAAASVSSQTGNTESSIHADYPVYDSLQALQEKSDLILRCKFQKREETSFENSPYTRMTIQVQEAYKGDAKQGDTLTFLQLGTNEAAQNSVVCNAYVSMQPDQEYVLFLTKSGEEYFMPSPAQSCYLWAEGDKALSPVLDSSVALSVKAEDLK